MNYIYKITNLINQKIYIGQTCDPKVRWSTHKTEARRTNPELVVEKAMKKYGIDNFQFEVICSVLSVDDEKEYYLITAEIETQLIEQEESHISKGKGYNISYGGSTARRTEAQKQHMREIWKSKSFEEKDEIIKRFSMVNKGKRRSPGTEFKKGEHIGQKTQFKKGHPGTTNIKWSPDQLQQIFDLRDNGLSFQKIANIFVVNKSVISRLIRLRYQN